MNWATAQTVTVTGFGDSDLTNDTVTLTHTATSTDSNYDGITIADVTVTVEDNDTAQVTGLMVTPGNARLVVQWTAVGQTPRGYEVQWKSGRRGLQQLSAGRGHSGDDHELHDPEPHQRDHVHGARESDPDRRQPWRVFGRGDGRAGGGQHSCHGRAGDHGHPAGRHDADGGEGHDRGRRRHDQGGQRRYGLRLQLPVAAGGRRDGFADYGCDGKHLHADCDGPGQDDQGAHELHRRRGHRGRTAHQRRDGGGAGGGGRLPDAERLVHDADGRVSATKSERALLRIHRNLRHGRARRQDDQLRGQEMEDLCPVYHG